MSLLVVGSVAYDGITTPHGKCDRILGGAGAYVALSASFFTKVSLIGVVGEDFAKADEAVLQEHNIDLRGLEHAKGKTFYWAGEYSQNMNERTTHVTELNVFEKFDPKVPDFYRDSPYLFLANIHPALQRSVFQQIDSPRFVGGDTMNFWIEGTPDDLRQTIKDWDFILINDGEARQLSGEYNLLRAARAIQAMGPSTVVIKRGEYGAILFRPEGYFVAPGFLLESVFDPTGAGDCFAGGFMGYLTEQGVTNIGDATHPQLRKAMIYGSVMGSFCCQQFGVGQLRAIDRADIDERFEEFRKFTEF